MDVEKSNSISCIRKTGILRRISRPGVLTIVMKTKTFTVLTNRSALLVSGNVGKNLEFNNSEDNSVRN